MQDDFDVAKLAVALRAARASLGWSQVEFGEIMGISKSTVARLETMEADISLGMLQKILTTYNKLGVSIDILNSESLRFDVDPQAIKTFQKRMADEANRRADRGRAKK